MSPLPSWYGMDTSLYVWWKSLMMLITDSERDPRVSVHSWLIAGTATVGCTSGWGSSQPPSLYVRDGERFRSCTCSSRRPIQSKNENRECLLRPWSASAGVEGWAIMSRLDHTHAHTKIIMKCKHRYALTTKNTHAGTQFYHPNNIKWQHRIKLLPYPLPATGRTNKLPHFPWVKRPLDEV